MHSHHTRYILGILFLVFLGCEKQPLFTCNDPIGCVSLGPNEPIVIGVIQDLSGSASVFGNVQVKAIQLALKERNYRLRDRMIELRIEDEGCRHEGGENASLALITQPKIVAVIGTTCSSAAVPAARILSNAGLTLISGLNTAPALTATGSKKGENWQPGYFRTTTNDSFRARASAEFAIKKLGIKKAATFDDGDAYTRGSTNVFTEEFTRLGGQVVFSATIDRGDSQMEPILKSIEHSNAQILIITLFPPEGLNLVRQVSKMASLDHLILMGGSALVVDTFIKNIGSHGTGMYFTAPTIPDGPGLHDLIRKYKKIYNEPPLNGYNTAYDAANMLLNAIEAVAVHKNDTLYIGRQALRDALYNTTDFKGTTGSLSCDQFGDCGIATSQIVRLADPASGAQGLKENVVYIYKDK